MSMFKKTATALFFSAALCGAAFPQSHKIGPWTILVLNSGELAMHTANDSGVLMSSVCEDMNSCLWVMSVSGATCEHGQSYPALINSTAGAFHTDLYCEVGNGTNRFVFSKQSSIASAASSGGILGVVLPMQSGSFSVRRFDTDRYAEANDFFVKVLKAAKKRTGNTNL